MINTIKEIISFRIVILVGFLITTIFIIKFIVIIIFKRLFICSIWYFFIINILSFICIVIGVYTINKFTIFKIIILIRFLITDVFIIKCIVIIILNI